MRLERAEFIATIAIFFGLTALPQIGLLIYYDILTLYLSFWSLLGLLPIVIFIPVGQFLAKKWSPLTFDKIILTALFIISIRLLII